jgi:hypothetical protein
LIANRETRRRSTSSSDRRSGRWMTDRCANQRATASA